MHQTRHGQAEQFRGSTGSSRQGETFFLDLTCLWKQVRSTLNGPISRQPPGHVRQALEHKPLRFLIPNLPET